MEVAEVRPESDALPVHDDNSIKSKQPKGASNKMDGKDEMKLQRWLYHSEAKKQMLCWKIVQQRMFIEVSDPVMGDD